MENTTPNISRLSVGTRVVIDADYDFRHGQQGTITKVLSVGYGVQLDDDTEGATGFPFDEVRPLDLPTEEDLKCLIKLHPHLAGLLKEIPGCQIQPSDLAGFVEERIIRQCPECTCWCYEDDFRECVGYIPGEGSDYETRDTCRWCREDIQ